jgi:preprotein translocase subunit SecF
MIPIIRLRKLWFAISGILFLGSILSLAVWELKFGIDFTGGTIQEIHWKYERPTGDALRATFKGKGIDDVVVQNSGERDTILRFKEIDETKHSDLIDQLKYDFATKGGGATEDVLVEQSFSSIGPTIGNELKTKSYYALAIVLLAIIIYIAWAFRRVSRPVASWKYGVAAIIALLHDVVIPTGVFSVLGHFLGYEIDILFVTGLLTVLGFSVHDTIVVFDRIRENLLKREGSFEEIVNFSVNQTIVRSVNTSFTVMLVLLAVYFFGGESVHNFTLVLILGVFFGTYSSIFIASPILVLWHNLKQRRSR